MKNVHKISAEQYGQRVAPIKAKEVGRVRITKAFVKSCYQPHYYWEIRDLLEKKHFETVKKLYSRFKVLHEKAHKDAVRWLKIGLFHALMKRDNFADDYYFKSDKHFKNLEKSKSADDIIKYFENKAK